MLIVYLTKEPQVDEVNVAGSENVFSSPATQHQLRSSEITRKRHTFRHENQFKS